MPDKKQLVIIKGTRDGITLFINDTCAYSDALEELDHKMDENNQTKEEPIVPVKVKLGNRYLDKDQESQLRHIIESKSKFTIEAVESDVVHREEALLWKEESEIKVVNQIVRSGQVLEITGDLLLVGDVNPGGKVRSTGNIYILGNLYGVAHAGVDGDDNAFIAASFMNPSQLRIADYISRAPDYESKGVYMECGLIDKEQNQIIIDRLQTLSRKRKEISSFERRVNNG